MERSSHGVSEDTFPVVGWWPEKTTKAIQTE